MKKLIVFVMLLTILTLTDALSAPEWVPGDKRESYDYMRKMAGEYLIVLESDAKIIKYSEELGYMHFTIKRGELITAVVVKKKMSVKQGLYTGGGGCLLGFLSALLVVIAL